MSRGQFRSRNTVGETFSFKNNSDSGDTLTVQVSFTSGSDRVHWDWGDGGSVESDNFTSHIYSDAGTIKTITMGTNRLSKLSKLVMTGDKIYGHLDMSGWDNLDTFGASSSFTNDNFNFTGITHTYSPQNFVSYDLQRNNMIGNHDMSMFPNLGGRFQIWSNPNLTGITHTASTQIFTGYRADFCNLTGTHDISMLTNLSDELRLNDNPNLTKILLTGNNNVFTQFYVQRCDILGNFDLSVFPNIGGDFRASFNSSLTGITHSYSPQVFTQYDIRSSDITGNHDLSMFPNLGGQIQLSSNSNLTGVTHTASTEVIWDYNIINCDITGNHDLSMFPNLGGPSPGGGVGSLALNTNPNLTSITFPTTVSGGEVSIDIQSCGIIGTLDVSMFTNLTDRLRLSSNPSLTNVLLPNSTGTFDNVLTTSGNRAFSFNSCDLGYVNFYPLSGATLNNNASQGCSIDLSNNSMTSAEVNHILTDFSGITSNNLSGWSGVTLLDIGGTNATPDTTSGGYNGIAAINYLTGVTAQWTIVTS